MSTPLDAIVRDLGMVLSKKALFVSAEQGHSKFTEPTVFIICYSPNGSKPKASFALPVGEYLNGGNLSMKKCWIDKPPHQIGEANGHTGPNPHKDYHMREFKAWRFYPYSININLARDIHSFVEAAEGLYAHIK